MSDYPSIAVIGGEGYHWVRTDRYLQWIVDPLDIEGGEGEKSRRSVRS
jgi:hypothetical protein